MSRWRIVFMGTPAFAATSLEALLQARERFEVVGVVTQPDRPAGRGRKLALSAVKELALAHDLPVLQPTKMRAPETAAALTALRPDAAVVAAYGRILPPALLAIPTHGCINVHASLLPRYRGASPIAHAILAGDAESGVSIMRMDEGCDTGPVFAMRSLALRDDETTASLTGRLATLGASVLVETLPAILQGELASVPQDGALASAAPLLRKEDGALDFRRPATELERRIRALDPWPGTYATVGDLRVGVLRARIEPDASGPPGEVIAADRDGILVGCGAGALRLVEVKPAGRKQMPASAWVAGRGVGVGDRFRLEAPA